MGPAGFTLAHHLMNDGHTVVGIDGLKIEPLDAEHLRRRRPTASACPSARSATWPSCASRSRARVMAGFGGVAEYGITVRWDKNFLKMARLLVERRAQFAMFGGVRFGGTLTAEDAFALGFDHIALAAGAGKPTVLDMPNGLARGVRTASDFLMALQLTGAARDRIDRQPAGAPADRGGGRRPHRDRHRHRVARVLPGASREIPRALRDARAASAAPARCATSGPRKRPQVAEEFLTHALAIRDERARPRREGRDPRILELLQSWGGSTIAYRKRLIDSPSYTLNHEEVEKALEEGIRFAENLTPMRVEVDDVRPARTRASRSKTRAKARRSSRRAPSSSPPARSPTPCSRARTRSISCSTAATSAPWTRTASR